MSLAVKPEKRTRLQIDQEGLRTELSLCFTEDVIDQLYVMLVAADKNLDSYFSEEELGHLLVSMYTLTEEDAPEHEAVVEEVQKLMAELDTTQRHVLDLHETCTFMKKTKLAEKMINRSNGGFNVGDAVKSKWADGLWRAGVVKGNPRPGVVVVEFDKTPAFEIEQRFVYALKNGQAEIERQNAPWYNPFEKFSTYSSCPWQNNTAQDKRTTLLNEVYSDRHCAPWPPIPQLLRIKIENMDTVFDHAGDDMPPVPLSLNTTFRPKLTHTVGVIAPCKWVSHKNHEYSGLFNGAANGFMRFSLARQWNLIGTSSDPAPVSPSITLKFTRDGLPSANMHLMYSLLGQKSFNFFENDLSSHLPMINAKDDTIDPKKVDLLNTFAKASKWPCMLGLSDFARYDTLGNKTETPKFPFRVHIHPSTKLRTALADACKSLPSPNEDSDYYIAQLEKHVSKGDAVYEIYVQATPESNEITGPIGHLEVEEAPSRTKFGDERMFFQHTRMEEDLKVKPEWSEPAQKIMDRQGSAIPPFYFPNLEWK
eukprot:PhM_4_TR10484/c1_g1_i2/m.18827